MVKEMIAAYIMLIGVAFTVYGFYEMSKSATKIAEGMLPTTNYSIVFIFIGFFVVFYGLMLFLMATRGAKRTTTRTMPKRPV